MYRTSVSDRSVYNQNLNTTFLLPNNKYDSTLYIVYLHHSTHKCIVL